MSPHLKKAKNQAHMETVTYEQIVSHLEKDLELKGLEARDELQINTVMQHDTKPNNEKPKLTCQQCQKSDITIVHIAVNSEDRKTKMKARKPVLALTKILIVVK